MPRGYISDIEGLRYCVRPEYAGLPAEDLHKIIENSISGLPNETAEDFLSTLSSVGKAIGPALQQAAPDAAKGAASGSTLGPWGALIGAGAGLASSLIKSQGKPASTVARAPSVPTSAIPGTASPPASATPSMPAVAAAATVPAAPQSLPTGQEAAATLISLFRNPTVQLSFLSQILGRSGNQEVLAPSGSNLPRGSINALLSELLARASDALPEAESISEQSYLRDSRGEYLIDPASFDQQAALVLSHLRDQGSPAPQSTNIWSTGRAPGDESAEWFGIDESYETVSFY